MRRPIKSVILSAFRAVILSAAKDLPLFLAISFLCGGEATAKLNDNQVPPIARALWVECEGTNDTLSSKAKIDKLIRTASQCQFNLLYVQLFRGNETWYESSLIDSTPAQEFRSRENADMLRYLIDQAHPRGIEVHGWINLIRVVRRPDGKYPLIEILGRDAFTRNGRGQSILDFPPAELPDGGYWLDPGCIKVQQFLGDLGAELVRKYPDLDGVHLDFIRLPSEGIQAGSMWDGGKGFGYGKRSVGRFQQKTDLNPLKMEKTRENCERWDEWRREQVTDVVRAVRKRILDVNPEARVTAAAQCWPERAYLSAFQDWGRWLEEGIVDAVVTMNYGTDNKLVQQLSRQALALKHRRHVYIGLGPYLYEKNLSKFRNQVENTIALQPEGIVFFSYDAMLKNPRMFDELQQNFFTTQAKIPSMPWKNKTSVIAAQESSR